MTDRERIADGLFVFGILVAVAAGGVVGSFCTWGFILVCNIVLAVVFVGCLIAACPTGSGLGLAFAIVSIPLFLVTSWCAFWISIAGVLRH